jgi:hypothetical protein
MLAGGFVGWFWALQNHGGAENQRASNKQPASTPSQIPTQTTAKKKVSTLALCVRGRGGKAGKEDVAVC